MAKASGRQEQSGKDLVFRQWFEDNIVAAGNGAAIEESAIVKAYRKDVAPGVALGRQGVHRMLNELGVRRSVRVGKPMRLNVGFKPVVSAVAVQPPSPRTVKEVRIKLPPVKVADLAKEARRPLSAPVPFHQVDGAVDRVEPVSMGVALANAPRDVFAVAMSIACEVAEERIRQQAAVKDGGEGFDIEHDDASDPGAHERAAATYAFAAGQADHHAAFVDTNSKRSRGVLPLGYFVRDMIVTMWPWPHVWWKPKTDEPDWRRRCMVKACALLLAAIERFDRENARATLEAAQAPDMTGV